MPEGPRYRLELVALPADAPAVVRLRHALKLFLRAFRLRCTSVVEVPSDSPPSTPPAPERLDGGE